MKIAAIYTRYSTDRQNHSSTLTQIDACEKYCKQQGYEVYDIYSDEAFTGTNINREAFARLNFDARKKKFDIVVIYEMGRSNRDIVDWFLFRRAMRELNIQVESVGEHLGDVLDPSAFLYEGVKAAVCQFQALDARKKSIDTKILLAKSGVFLGGVAPLGYDIQDQKYVINEKEAQAVRLIFEMYDDGYKKTDIVKALKEMGYVNKKGSEIKLTSIYDILRNERYAGTYSWMTHKTREMNKHVGYIPTTYGTKIEDSIPAIIDKDLFRRVQSKMTQRKEGISSVHHSNYKNTYLLSGKIVCGKCGARMQGRTAKNQRGLITSQYICPNKIFKKTCSQCNLSAKDVEDTVLFKLAEWLRDIDSESLTNLIAEKMVGFKPDKSLEMKLKKIQTEQKNIMEAIKSGGYVKSMSDDLRKLDKQEEVVREQILEQEQFKASVGTSLDEIVEKILEDSKNITPGNLKIFVDYYVREVRAYDDEIEIDFGITGKKNIKKAQQLLAGPNVVALPLADNKDSRLDKKMSNVELAPRTRLELVTS